MDITKAQNADGTTFKISGRLDTLTAPEAEKAVMAEALPSKLVFDLGDLEYISSAGLRVLLSVHKKMLAGGGTMTVTGCNETVMDILETTGLSTVLNIE